VSAITVAVQGDLDTVPTIRRLPVPIAEPRPALRVVREDDTAVSAAQSVLTFGSAPEATIPLPLGDTGSRVESLAGPAGSAVGRAESAGARAARLESEAVARFCAAVPTPTTALPDPKRWAGQFVQAAVEVAAGQRPAVQLVRWTSEEVHATLVRRARLTTRRTRTDAGRAHRPTRAIVHSVRVCSPSDGVVEACAVVTDRARVRAVALRLEGLDGRWRVTALEIG
jgi:hypothetical protein